MEAFTLTNDFHNTSATVRPEAIKEGRFAGMHKISRATMLRTRRQLCGIAGCTCGGQFGERSGGAYICVVNEDAERNIIVDLGASHE